MEDFEVLDGIAEAPESEDELEDVLQNLFEGLKFASVDEPSSEVSTDEFQDQLAALAGCSARTFRDAQMMTHNRGLVVRLRNGAEFQLQIVRSN